MRQGWYRPQTLRRLVGLFVCFSKHKISSIVGFSPRVTPRPNMPPKGKPSRTLKPKHSSRKTMRSRRPWEVWKCDHVHAPRLLSSEAFFLMAGTATPRGGTLGSGTHGKHADFRITKAASQLLNTTTVVFLEAEEPEVYRYSLRLQQ